MTTSLTRWLLGSTIAAFIVVVPVVYYRWEYTYSKRLREIVPGEFYRSGQLTADGFREAIVRYRLKTIINLQDEYPDPDLAANFFSSRCMKESELCRQLGVNYLYLVPDMVPRREVGQSRPTAIDRFLEIMDDPATYPVLIHCRAGLHRTGIMAAVYRMEYQGWTPAQAVADLRANGFGDFACSSSNDYIQQYILAFQPRVERGVSAPRAWR